MAQPDQHATPGAVPTADAPGARPRPLTAPATPPVTTRYVGASGTRSLCRVISPASPMIGAEASGRARASDLRPPPPRCRTVTMSYTGERCRHSRAPRWWNRQTRGLEGAVPQGVGVQISSSAPTR